MFGPACVVWVADRPPCYEPCCRLDRTRRLRSGGTGYALVTPKHTPRVESAVAGRWSQGHAKAGAIEPTWHASEVARPSRPSFQERPSPRPSAPPRCSRPSSFAEVDVWTCVGLRNGAPWSSTRDATPGMATGLKQFASIAHAVTRSSARSATLLTVGRCRATQTPSSALVALSTTVAKVAKRARPPTARLPQGTSLSIVTTRLTQASGDLQHDPGSRVVDARGRSPNRCCHGQMHVNRAGAAARCVRKRRTRPG